MEPLKISGNNLIIDDVVDVAGALFGIVLFFALACLLHDLIPVCHYLFRCDHRVGH